MEQPHSLPQTKPIPLKQFPSLAAAPATVTVLVVAERFLHHQASRSLVVLLLQCFSSADAAAIMSWKGPQTILANHSRHSGLDQLGSLEQAAGEGRCGCPWGHCSGAGGQPTSRLPSRAGVKTAMFDDGTGGLEGESG